MKPNRLHCATSMLVKAAILASFACTASAVQAESTYDPVAEATAQRYEISVSEAKYRLARIAEAGQLDRKLQLESSETFAGLYVQHQPSFQVIVKFTKLPAVSLAQYTSDPLYKAEQAPRSLEYLRAVQDEIGEQLLAAGIEFESGIDLETSGINVYVLHPKVARHHLAALLAVAGHFIRVHKTDTFMERTAISGGNQVSGTSQKCTSGFNVVDANREIGILTAGHCDDALMYHSPSVQLAFQGEQDGGSYDVQWNKQSSGTPQQQRNVISGAPSDLEITSVTDSSALPVGATVCKVGITTKLTCGEVADKSFQAVYKGVIGTSIRVRNSNNNVMTESGDSGGPVFGGNSAHGVVHGRGGPNSPYRNDLFYMPIERISILGVSVITEPFDSDVIPNASGPHGSLIPIDVNFKGYPKFPVEMTLEVVQCPAGWQCTGGVVNVPTNVPSPFGLTWSCNAPSSFASATFRLKTTLKDASLITPDSVEHEVTCIGGSNSTEHIEQVTPWAGVRTQS